MLSSVRATEAPAAARSCCRSLQRITVPEREIEMLSPANTPGSARAARREPAELSLNQAGETTHAPRASAFSNLSVRRTGVATSRCVASTVSHRWIPWKRASARAFFLASSLSPLIARRMGVESWAIWGVPGWARVGL
eukprot:scaffold260032_cov33-Tisochrysis_lutea.AAC.3